MTKNRLSLRTFSIILGFIGLVDSIYLVYVKYANNPKLCIQGVGDCWTVNTSVYSQVFGIPIALIGAIGYLSILVLLLMEDRSDFWKANSIFGVFGLSLVGVLYSVYLTYLEIAVIQAICPFCIISAITMLALFSSTLARLIRSQSPSYT